MSMNFYAVQLTQLEVARVKRDPTVATAMTGAAGLREDGLGSAVRALAGMDLYTLRRPGAHSALNRPGVAQMLRREIERQRRAQGAGRPPGTPTEARPRLDLHKSWHILHYLFTGSAHGGIPPANALLAGREIGEDLGYGPPRLHEPAATAAFARFVEPLTVEDLSRRLDVARMSELGIYCCEDAASGAAEELGDDVAHYFPELKRFVGEAAAAGKGLLAWLS